MVDHESRKRQILAEAKAIGLKGQEAKILSTDPFFVGSPADYENAKWVANTWGMMIARRKSPIHLRGFHYWMQVINAVKYGSKLLTKQQIEKLKKALKITNIEQMDGYLKPDGKPYAGEDPTKDWHLLLRAAVMARYLGISELDSLIDLKHPDPEDYDNYWVGSGLDRIGNIDVQGTLDSKIDGLTDEIIDDFVSQSPKYHASGYQMYHCEVWIEKQSQAHVISPICKRYGAVYQALVGQSSIEKVNMAAKRAVKAAEAGKKVRIFYISDWDRYGWTMVSAVARKIEFLTQGHPNIDIKLTRLALNDSQIDEYALPKAPKHDEDVVELDALEAIYPGELGKIITEALDIYVDKEKVKKVSEENQRMRAELRGLLDEKLRQPLHDAISIVDVSDLGHDIELASVIDTGFKAPLPGHIAKEDNHIWMFDSTRDYWLQYQKYLEYKSSREEEEPNE